MCLAQLAARLAAAPGTGFFGFLAESLRVFRILLNRTDRLADPVHWAFYARGALLARAQLAAPRDLTKLAAACEEAALRASLLADRNPKAECLAQDVLWLAVGELLVVAGQLPVQAGELVVRAGDLSVPAGDGAPFERAVMACTRSYEAARELGKRFKSFAFDALKCRASAQRSLGASLEERATLAEALKLAPAQDRDRIKARLRELATAQPVPVTPTWWEAAVVADQERRVGAIYGQTGDRVIHMSPFRAQAAADLLVLRPLVTALAPTVPNRFVALFRHDWRFQDEPPAMTFEETLSRALGHRFSFIAIGAEFEALGIGRLESSELPGHEDSEAWKRKVEILMRDPLMCRIVLVHPSDSPGMQWELDLLASTVREEQARFFLIPPHVDADVGRSEWDRARRALEARHLMIPAWEPAGLVFRHDAHGAVAMCDTFEAVWDGRFAEWLQAYANEPDER